MVKVFSTMLATTFFVASFVAPAQAASAPAPKVGQCFKYTAKHTAMKSIPKKAKVSCSKAHNIEVYRVATWDYVESPYELSDNDVWEIANEACQPWDEIDASTDFNYWFFYVPTKAQWNKGQRWIRCDAGISLNGDGTSLAVFKGKRLDVR